MRIPSWPHPKIRPTSRTGSSNRKPFKQEVLSGKLWISWSSPDGDKINLRYSVHVNCGPERSGPNPPLLDLRNPWNLQSTRNFLCLVLGRTSRTRPELSGLPVRPAHWPGEVVTWVRIPPAAAEIRFCHKLEYLRICQGSWKKYNKDFIFVFLWE